MSMVQLYAFRRLLVALALCLAAIAASVTPASVSARSHHGAGRHAHARHAGHHARRHYGHRHYRHIARESRWKRVAQMQARGFPNGDASIGSGAAPGATAISGGLGSSNVVAEARRYIGRNPTGRGSLWCARLMNMVLQHSGYRGTGSDLARSFARYGQRVFGPQIGALAGVGRRRGGPFGLGSGIET